MASEAPDWIAGERSWRRLQAVVESMRQGRPWAVLVGAGPSIGVGIPGWKKLLTDLKGLGGPGVPEDVAGGALPVALGRTLGAVEADAFWMAVKDLVCSGGSGTPGEVYMSLSGLPFNVFTTTNYDHLLRDAFLAASGPEHGEALVVSYPDLNARDLERRCLIHLHGCCHQIQSREPGSNPSIVLTQDQYDAAYAPGSILPSVLRQLFSEFRVLMLGTSLQDGRLNAVLQEARYLAEEKGRTGDALPFGIHKALTALPMREQPEVDSDLRWEGSGTGVEPIYYYNPPGDRHKGLVEALRFLDSVLGLRPSAQYEFGVESE